MAQPQPSTQQPTQAQSQQPAFSPPAQHSPSPAASQSAFAPPQKRVRTDGAQSQPDSPYANSPYAMSPVAGAGTPGSSGSPQNAQSPALPGQQTPYTNGVTTPILNLPEARPSPTPPLQTPQIQTPAASTPQYTNATLAVNLPGQPGTMGPPQRPADKPTKEYDYDPMDTLAGTGIDLRAEEQYMAELYSNFDSDARNGYAQHPAGGKSSFYGAGPANQPAEGNTEESQEKIAAQAAEKAWNESAMRLAAQRTQEINDPFLLVAILHRRAEKVAKEHNLGLNLDMKNPAQPLGKMKVPQVESDPSVTVQTKPGPDGAMVTTTGSFLPHDSYLVDQLALLSIATKTRLRDLVEDAGAVAAHRQKTSHGEIPEDWEPAAAPLNMETPEAMEVDGLNPDGTPAAGESARKREYYHFRKHCYPSLLNMIRPCRYNGHQPERAAQETRKDLVLFDNDHARPRKARARMGGGAPSETAETQGRDPRFRISAVSVS